MLILIKGTIETHLVILEATEPCTFDACTEETLSVPLQHQGLSSELLWQKATAVVGSDQLTAE